MFLELMAVCLLGLFLIALIVIMLFLLFFCLSSFDCCLPLLYIYIHSYNIADKLTTMSVPNIYIKIGETVLFEKANHKMCNDDKIL